jgi:hypothetical protein
LLFETRTGWLAARISARPPGNRVAAYAVRWGAVRGSA